MKGAYLPAIASLVAIVECLTHGDYGFIGVAPLSTVAQAC